ncbi:MAG: class I SAM-dependent methyltransferase [Candidatus Aminicenantales bacterium]
MREEPWQLQVLKRSLKKKEKIKLLENRLDVSPSSRCLDLGCAQGTLSFFLRKQGGMWWSADLDFINLKSAQGLLQTGLLQVEPGPLPFKSGAFDLVVSLDYLEHLDEDEQCLQEIHRVLKPNGRLILATPRTGTFFFLHRVRSLLGMKLEFYGHKREGYTRSRLESLLIRTGFVVRGRRNFARFFTELLELAANVAYIRVFRPETPPGLRDGRIKPTTLEEFRSKKTAFRAYSFIYPFAWLVSRLDRLFFFQRGYGLMIWAEKASGKTQEQKPPGDGAWKPVKE